MRLHLDYETASELDLKKVGAYKYARDASTRVLMLGWAFGDEGVQLWQPAKGAMPPRLLAGLYNDAVMKVAFNAAFERLITEFVLAIRVPAEQWSCTMVESYYLGFAGKMDNVLEAAGLQKKDPRGGRLINMFCKPAPKNHKADWYDESNRPTEWGEFCMYCVQDVEVERQLWHWLRKFPVMNDWDVDQWYLDQKINDTGVPMDVEMAHSAVALWATEKEVLTGRLKALTELPLVTRGPFKEWLERESGIEIENMRKDYLQTLLSKGELPAHVIQAIGLWAQKEGKATSKYNAVINGTCDDGRARGMFQYKGASRTDRVGGRLIQLQNLKRPIYGDTPESIGNVVSAIKSENPDLIGMLYDDTVSDILGGSIRHAISAPVGSSFAVSDLTSIESVILGWIANCPSIDATFRAGRDSYKVFASEYYGIDYGEVTKKQRGFSKPPVLGCGFMLGWKGLIAYSEGYGVEMSTEQAKNAVSTFRGMYPEIPRFWDWIQQAVLYTTTTGLPSEGYRLKVERDMDMLRIWLPSGRALSYFMPEIRKMDAPWSTPEKPAIVENFTYMGMDMRNQWVRISAHAGGLTENIVQSIAGDVLWSGLTNADKAGLSVCLHVHDEIAVISPDVLAESQLATLQECMIRTPMWADGLWLGADGFVTKRYTKD